MLRVRSIEDLAVAPPADLFSRDGVIGPVRVFPTGQCPHIAALLRKSVKKRPREWVKSQAINDRFLYEIASRQSLLAHLRTILGPDVILWGARLIERTPGQAHVWHTDIESSDPQGGFATVWIGLENTSRQSALQLITRSHAFGKSIQQVRYEKGMDRSESTADRVLAWADEIDSNVEFLQPQMTDGEALIFDGRLWHGSLNTRRRGTRTALLLQYAEATRAVRRPDPKQVDWPFRFLNDPLPPVIQISGTSPEGVNRVVPPPAPEDGTVAPPSSAVYPLPLPLTEDAEKGWRPHRIFRGATPILDFMGCHASILSAGHSPHPPHAHAEEEILIPLDGEAELIISDSPEADAARSERVRPGSFVYYPAYQHHTIRNASTSPVTYLMFKWRADASGARQPFATGIHSIDCPAESTKPRAGRRLFREPTAYLGALSAHVTLLQPGAGYEPHVDDYDVAILLLSGTVRTLNQTISAPGVIYYLAGEPHGMENVGEAPARYLVFEFRPSARRSGFWRRLTPGPSAGWFAFPRGRTQSRRRRLFAKRVRTARQRLVKRVARIPKTVRRIHRSAERSVRQRRGRLSRLAQRRFRRLESGLRHSVRNPIHRAAKRIRSLVSKMAKRLKRRSRRTLRRATKPILKGPFSKLTSFVRLRTGTVHTPGSAEKLRAVRQQVEPEQLKDTPKQARQDREREKGARLAQRRDREIQKTIRQARKLARAGDYHRALALYDGAPDAQRDDARMLHGKALLFKSMGQLNHAYDLFTKELSLDPLNPSAWKLAGATLANLDRSGEIPAFIQSMFAALPRTPQNLIAAAQIAKKGRRQDLYESLLAEALLPDLKPSAGTLVKGARMLLQQDDQGRAIELSERKAARIHPRWKDVAADLRGLALAQLRLANGTGDIDKNVPAGVAVVRSLLETPPVHRERRGMAIILNSLGPGGTERQVVGLARRICTNHTSRSGPVRLFLVGRSKLAPQFYLGDLEGLNITIEAITDFDSGVISSVPPALAGKLGLLPSKIGHQTSFLIDRLGVHQPKAVLAMGENAGLSAALAASAVGSPRVVVSGSGEPPSIRGLSDAILNAAYREALSANRATLVAISAATAQIYAEWLDRPSDSVAVVYNGVDVDRFRSKLDPDVSAAHRVRCGIDKGTRVVGSIFNGRWEKRRDLWVQAAAIVARRQPNVAFVLIGAGHDGNDLHNTLTRLGLEGRVHTPGLQHNVATWLDMMDVVLLTSASEGTPNVLLEAQALGRPVVSTAVGGCAETFLPGETGILVETNPTPEEVADAVMKVLDDPGFAERARTLGPQFIRRRFDPARMTNEILDLCFGGPQVLPERAREPELLISK